MHVTLINPSNISADKGATFSPFPPIGLAYLAAAAREAGHQIVVIDSPILWREQCLQIEYGQRTVYATGGSFEQIERSIGADTQVVGVTCMFMHQWPWVRDLVNHIKQKRPELFVVLGGEHASGGRAAALKDSAADCIVRGEGEESFVALLGALQGSEEWRQLDGISIRGESESVVDNNPRSRIRDIDAIAPPAWELFDLQPYFEARMFHGPSLGVSMPILATRGCPYQCTFCTSPQMWTTRWLARDPKAVVNEMAQYRELYGANDFQFTDLTAVVKKQWILDFCDELLSRSWDDVRWQLPSGTRSEAVDFEVAQKMYRTGCKLLTYAPESGSVPVLKRIKKKTTPDAIVHSIRSVRKAGLRVECFFIMGTPGESLLEIMQSYAFYVRLAWHGVTSIIISGYRPVPDTEISDELEKNHGLVWDDETCIDLVESTSLFGGRSYHQKYNDLQIAMFRFLGYFVFFSCSFLLRPWRLATLLANVISNRQTSKLDKALIEMKRRKRATSIGA